MRHYRPYHILLLICGCTMGVLFSAQAQTKVKKTRILFLLDASSSMTYDWTSGTKRFEVASNILLNIVDSIYAINNEVEFAVRAYGTTYPAQLKNCTDTRLEVPFNIQNAYQIKTRLKNIQAMGFSPIAYSLMQAAENELSMDAQYDYSIILINDGGESCQGDVCETFRKYLQNKIKVRPYIIGLDQNIQMKSYYDCIGNYIPVVASSDIPVAIQTIVDAHRPILDKPKSLNLQTQFSNTPIVKDSVPVVKEIIPAVERKIDLIEGYLQWVVYPKKSVSKTVMNGLYLITKRPTVIIAWEMADPPKKVEPIAIPRVTDVMPFLKFKPSWIYTKTGQASIKVAAINNPPRKKVTILYETETPRTTDVFPYLTMNGQMPLKIKKETPKAKIQKSPKYPKVIVRYEPEIKRDTLVFPLLRMAFAPFKLEKQKATSIAKMKWKRGKVNIALDPPEKLPELKILASIPYPKRVSYAYALPKSNPLKWKRQKVSILVDIPGAKPPAKKDSIAAKPPVKSMPGDVEFQLVTEPAMETLVQVYFLGPNGKTYPKYKPMIQLVDKVKNQAIDTFKREMKGADPYPQPIQEGLYNFVVLGSNNLYANNIQIEANKINKVYIKVKEGSLYFTLMGDRNKVVPYKAVVNRRFAEGSTIYQNCSDIFYYEPGTYYVEILTVPVTKHVVYMDFEVQYEIQIAQPGKLLIENTEPKGKIMLQSQLGDDYATFQTISVNGVPADQVYELQPGAYRMVIPIDARYPERGTRQLEFKIKSNMETSLMLE